LNRFCYCFTMPKANSNSKLRHNSTKKTKNNNSNKVVTLKTKKEVEYIEDDEEVFLKSATKKKGSKSLTKGSKKLPQMKAIEDSEDSDNEVTDSESDTKSESETESDSSDEVETTKKSNLLSDDDESDDNVASNTGFTDENASWLKPKRNNSSDDDEGSDDDDSEEELDVEAKSRVLEQEKIHEMLDAHKEMQFIKQAQSIFHLPTTEELEEEKMRPLDLKAVKRRIQDVVEVLSKFAERREATRSRNEYLEVLEIDIAEYYGYNRDLVDLFLKLFNTSEALEWFESNETERPVVIRTNTLKTRRRELAQALLARGVNVEPLAKWSKVGLKVYESPVPIGATPEYLSGHYMLQSAASFLPVIALAPQQGERILDMCSAPGGKTSYIAQLMRNTGLLVANDLKAPRLNATVANLHRLGIKNTIVVNHNGKDFPKVMGGFDRILLDAPCSGLGVISRDVSIKVNRNAEELMKLSHLQKELLRAAVDSVDAKSKTGGIIVYSTCSVSVEENETVVDYILKKRDVKIVDCGLPFGRPGLTRYQRQRFHPSVALSRRYYPHVHNTDGFFVCKFKKLSNKKLDADEQEVVSEDELEQDDMAVEDDEDDTKKSSKKGKRSKTKDTKSATGAGGITKEEIVKKLSKKRKHEEGSDKVVSKKQKKHEKKSKKKSRK
jgi:ribosomal RNA methyltransferase Nop2